MDKIEFLEQEEAKINNCKMEDNRYTNGRIYKLVDTANGYFYIGSTCNPLTKRVKHT